MKKNYYLAFLIPLFCTFSCNNEVDDNLSVETSKMEKNYISTFNNVVSIPSESINWDVSHHPSNDSLDLKTRATNNTSIQMSVTNDQLYLSAPYSAKSIHDLTYSRIPVRLKSAFVTYTYPGYHFEEVTNPTFSTMGRALQKAIESPKFSGKQLQGFEYDYKEFKHYSELKLAFGANVNIAQIFKLNVSHNEEHIKLKAGLFARVVQKNFSSIMDYPEDGTVFKNDSDLKTYGSLSPVYINTITYGRMAIIAIESNESYDKLKTAFNASLTAKVINGDLNIDAESLKILKSASVRIFVSGGKGNDVAQIVTGFDKFTQFIVNGGEFTKQDPGVPIFFTANYVHDDSVFTTKFVTE